MSAPMPQGTICPVILSGGVGSRLWPLSRDEEPKQFQPLISKLSMLQETALRVADPAAFGPPTIVSSHVFAARTKGQLEQLGISGRLILEPQSRGTAAAVALAALDLADRGLAEAVMLVLPADHLVQDLAAFLGAVEAGAALSRAGYLVALGIQPTAPQTGYGYIRRGTAIEEDTGTAFLIESFKEKPDLTTALHYLSTGEYFWNAGIFLFRAADLLREMNDLCPEVLAACRSALQAGKEQEDGILADAAGFAACPPGSLDIVVMERTRQGAVVPASMGWSDVGSWEALWQVSNKDSNANVLIGDSIALDSKGCYGRSEGDLTLALIGLEDVVAVAVGTTILVSRREASEKVKDIYETLKKRAMASG